MSMRKRLRRATRRPRSRGWGTIMGKSAPHPHRRYAVAARADHPLPLGEGWGEGNALQVEPCSERGSSTFMTSASGFRRCFTLTPKPEGRGATDKQPYPRIAGVFSPADTLNAYAGEGGGRTVGIPFP